MAAIEAYQVKDGRRYRVRYYRPDRVQTTKRGFRTKRDAEAFAATVETSKLKGEFIEASAARATVGELGPDWLKRKLILKPSSYRPLESTWRIHVEPKWGHRRVSEIRATEIQDWVSSLSAGDATEKPVRKPKSATVVLRAYGILAALLDDAVKDRRLLANPARSMDNLPRKTKKPHVYLSHEQVHELAAASKYPTLILTLAYCGLRWGEAVGLRVQDLDMLKRRLRVEQNAVQVGQKIEVGTPKNHKRRAVPFPRFLVEPLAAQCVGKGRSDLVFPGGDGGYLRSARVHEDNQSWFAGAVKRSGIPRITPHDLRHSAASFAVSAGANVKAVQRMLGHSSASMTLDIYAELFDEDLNAVADALDAAVSMSLKSKISPKAVPGA